MKPIDLTWEVLGNLAFRISSKIWRSWVERFGEDRIPFQVNLYGVPRGGIPAALLVKSSLERYVAEATKMNQRPIRVSITENPELADIFIDDIVDSGRTRLESQSRFKRPFYALVEPNDRLNDPYVREQVPPIAWVTFPWERGSKAPEQGPEENVVRMLQYIGEDPNRDGLKETPSRVVRSYAELFSGYKVTDDDLAKMLKTFKDIQYDEMILCSDIPVYSFCEHHLLPFVGKAHIGYVPNQGVVVGLSKLARLLEVYSRRLQVQERLTVQVTQALDRHLKPKGAACVIEAEHMCIACRGVSVAGTNTVTSSLTGVFRDVPEVRAEFMNLIRSRRK